MKYYIIAGEASGDLHGSYLMKALQEMDSSADFRCWGGDLMHRQKGALVKHYKDTAFMGFWEIVKHLGKIKQFISFCKKDILAYNPDALILIDYPGFNLRIAKFAKSYNYPVFYYISPKIWAWKTSRVKIIRKYVDRMFSILPFEVDFYKKYNYEVEYVGNPLVDLLDEKKKDKKPYERFLRDNNLENKPIIAVLPGSRIQEIEKCLPDILEATSHFKDYQIVIAALSSVDKNVYESIVNGRDVKFVYDKTHQLLMHARAAVVVSGTAVLEAAILNVPQVALYKVSPVTFLLKPFLKIKYFTLPNIIMGKEIVKELLQHNLSKDIYKELKRLLADEDYRKEMNNNYQLLMKKLEKRNAAYNTASRIIECLSG